MRVGNRGVSPVVASVLLILLVFVLTAFVFSWARTFILNSSDNGEFSASYLCSTVDFNIVFNGISSSDVYNFDIVNRGNVNISSLKFKVYSGGDSRLVNSGVGILVDGANSGSVELSGTVDEVEVLPVLNIDSSDVVCINDPVYFYSA